VWQLWQLLLLAMWLAGLPVLFDALWQVTHGVPATVAWLKGAVAGAVPDVRAEFALASGPFIKGAATAGADAAVGCTSADAVAATVPARGAGVVPVRVGVVVVGEVRGLAGARIADLSRELWQPEPPQS
jgi:hypothetical protein